MKPLVRTDLGGTAPGGNAECLLALWLMSDVQVLDAASPARGEWVELLGDSPKWQPLLPMHRPYESLTHWALAEHVDKVRRDPTGPHSRRPYDLALSLGDNIDNAQHNELDAFLAIVAGGRAQDGGKLLHHRIEAHADGGAGGIDACKPEAAAIGDMDLGYRRGFMLDELPDTEPFQNAATAVGQRGGAVVEAGTAAGLERRGFHQSDVESDLREGQR